MRNPVNIVPLVELIESVNPDIQRSLLRQHALELLEEGQGEFALTRLERVGTIEDITSAVSSLWHLNDGYADAVAALRPASREELGDNLLAGGKYEHAVGVYQTLKGAKRQQKLNQAMEAALQTEHYGDAFHAAVYSGERESIRQTMAEGYRRKWDEKLEEEIVAQASEMGRQFANSVARRIMKRNAGAGARFFLEAGSEQGAVMEIDAALQLDENVYGIAQQVYWFVKDQKELSDTLRYILASSANRLYEVAQSILKPKIEEAKKESLYSSSEYTWGRIRELKEDLRKTIVGAYELAQDEAGLAQIIIDYVTNNPLSVFEEDLGRAAELYNRHNMADCNGLGERILQAAVEHIKQGNFEHGFKAAEMIQAGAADIPARAVRQGVYKWVHDITHGDFCIERKYGTIISGLGFLQQYKRATPEERALLGFYRTAPTQRAVNPYIPSLRK